MYPLFGRTDIPSVPVASSCLWQNSNIEIIGGGLFFTEIEVKNDNEKFVPSESDKEAIRKNIEEIECLKIQSP
jgi:hypothetical protein